MGREIRRVPPNYQHPMRDCPHSPWAGGCDTAKRNNGKCYQPLYDRDYESEMSEWIENHNLWLSGDHPCQSDPNYPSASECKYYAQFEGNPPDVDYYPPKWAENEATWFQLYETVSEGTPVSPPFATQDELIDYLQNHGDFWDQLRGEGPYSREAAERMVRGGWAPSGIGIGGKFYAGAEGLVQLDREAEAKENR